MRLDQRLRQFLSSGSISEQRIELKGETNFIPSYYDHFTGAGSDSISQEFMNRSCAISEHKQHRHRCHFLTFEPNQFLSIVWQADHSGPVSDLGVDSSKQTCVHLHHPTPYLPCLDPEKQNVARYISDKYGLIGRRYIPLFTSPISLQDMDLLSHQLEKPTGRTNRKVDYGS